MPNTIKSKNRFIGLMSGTSIDGIDLICVDFSYTDSKYSYDILASHCYAYSDEWRKKLTDLVNISPSRLTDLHFKLGHLFSEKVKLFISEYNLQNIDYISSHGHTALHNPQENYTLQIGNPICIMQNTQIPVIADFRSQDVVLGGQGAPLVPIGDKYLFSEYSYKVNLGGFANMSSELDNSNIAYDICPANIILNSLVKKMNLDFDDKGKIAENGTFVKEIYDSLNKLDFYKQTFPKSLGVEWVSKNINPLMDTTKYKTEDLLNTYCHHIAYQISQNIKPNSKVLFTGGGVFNDYLMKLICYYSKIEYSPTSNTIVEFKEALIFAFLGFLRVLGKTNCLSSVTGASHDHCSGTIYKLV